VPAVPSPRKADDMRGLFSLFISLLFGKSLATGCFPQEFNEAVVRTSTAVEEK